MIAKRFTIQSAGKKITPVPPWNVLAIHLKAAAGNMGMNLDVYPSAKSVSGGMMHLQRNQLTTALIQLIFLITSNFGRRP
jgi:hypothetical protein